MTGVPTYYLGPPLIYFTPPPPPLNYVGPQIIEWGRLHKYVEPHINHINWGPTYLSGGPNINNRGPSFDYVRAPTYFSGATYEYVGAPK